MNRSEKLSQQRTALTANEESLIVQLLLNSAERRMPLNRNHLVEAASMFIESLPHIRKATLSFRNGGPGARWIRNFYARHINSLKYFVPAIQEQKRFAAVNAETLETHFSALHALDEKY